MIDWDVNSLFAFRVIFVLSGRHGSKEQISTQDTELYLDHHGRARYR